jgi:predicted DCC family thiol-disulfide oxidoreductase YuxK
MAEQVLLYDGTCGFCAASVQFILRHERQRTLQFAPLEGTLAAGIRARHPELEGIDSLVWVDGVGTPAETVLVKSRAVLRAAGYLGRFWGVLRLGWLVPVALRDGLYDFVARHRHRILRAPEQCYIPPPAVRARFLE